MFKNKEEFKFEFSRRIIESYGRTVEEAHITEKFMVLETMVRDYASVNWAASKAVVQNNEQKQMHYFSMEFLMGRFKKQEPFAVIMQSLAPFSSVLKHRKTSLYEYIEGAIGK